MTLAVYQDVYVYHSANFHSLEVDFSFTSEKVERKSIP